MDDSELLQCPYEPSHRILPARFQIHLGRCRRNHKNMPKVTCPFNICHVLNKAELDYHVTVCPERASFEKFKHRDEIASTSISPDEAASTSTSTSESKFALPEPQTNSENWDDDPPVPSYNPQSYASNARILRNLQGVTPSEKKEFRRKERERLLNIKQ